MREIELEYVGKLSEYDITNEVLNENLLKFDYVSFNEFENITIDFTTSNDFQVYRGKITRSGDYIYGTRTVRKDWTNLKDIFSEIDYLPVKFAEKNAHYGEVVGYCTNFSFDDLSEHIEADIVIFRDLNYPNILHLPLSIGFKDRILSDGTQQILWVDHLAMAINDIPRCGKTCYAEMKDNN